MSHNPANICHHPHAGKAVKSSFYWAMRLMPKAQREAMFVVYGFCREVDDIADSFEAPEDKMKRLEDWRSNIGALYSDDEPPNELACLRQVIDGYGLKQSDFLDVIDGMEMDTVEPVRIQDAEEFDLYMDRVASAVGRLSDKVFGVEGLSADRLAYHLGRGLQITNILRDLDEDAARGRLYLPLSLLKDVGIDAQSPGDVLGHANLHPVLVMLAGQAHDHFAQARAALSQLDKTKTRPARIMMAVYERILGRLEERGLTNIKTRVALPKWQKLWLALYHGLF